MSSGSPPRSAHLPEPDYLARLVDRAAQRVPLLERRRPSLFEQPTGQVPHAEHNAEHVAVEAGLPRPAASPHTEPLRAAPRTVPPPRQTAASMAPRAATLDAMALEVQAVHVKPPQTAAAIVDTRPVEPARQNVARALAMPELSSQPASLLSSAEPAVRGVTSIEHVHHHTERVVEVHHAVTQSLMPPEPRRERVSALETAAEQHEHVSSSTPPQPTTPALSADWTRLARPEAIAQPARAASVRAAAAPTPAAPAPVQISIGRVEVRATAPAATGKPRSGPRAPQLSLEEYLRERGGGSR